jgi:hypothetical protein
MIKPGAGEDDHTRFLFPELLVLDTGGSPTHEGLPAS